MTASSRKILVALPEPLVKKLDAAAKKSERSRTAEVRTRLAESFKAAARPARAAL